MEGQWFPRQAIQFQGGPLLLTQPSPGYSFTMTAGHIEIPFEATGYYPSVPIGEIDAEPIEEAPLFIFIKSALIGNIIAFVGNAESILVGLSVWVNGVKYPPDAEWSFDGDYTSTGWGPGNEPPLVDEGVYFVEIK